MAAQVSSLEEEAMKRKERLKSMRKKSGVPNEEEESITSRGEKRTAEESSAPVKVIKFRNYMPKDDSLKEQKIPNAKPLSVEEEVKDHLEKAKSEKVIEEVDLANLAPRKPDWDLKRDVAKKLEKLEKRTQRAIVELIRDRLQAGEQDLVSAVNAAADQHYKSD